MRAYLSACLQGSECPFDGTVDSGMQTVGALLDSVDASPIRAPDGRELGGSTLFTAIIYPLYDANAWGMLSDMLESVMHGDAEMAFEFADAYNGRNADGSYSDNSTEAFMAVNCMDYCYNADPALMREQAVAMDEAAPVIGRYMSYGDIGCANGHTPSKGNAARSTQRARPRSSCSERRTTLRRPTSGPRPCPRSSRTDIS